MRQFQQPKRKKEGKEFRYTHRKRRRVFIFILMESFIQFLFTLFAGVHVKLMGDKLPFRPSSFDTDD